MRMEDGTKNYLQLNNKYLREAEDLIGKGDYVQASEKFWDAAAEIVKAVAANRKTEIRSHGDLHRFVARLKQELNDPELPRLFGLAGELHQNFYENWLPPETVVDYGEAVKQLVRKLKRLIER